MRIPVEVVQLVLERLREAPVPEENAAQVAFKLGWLEALAAIESALDVAVERERAVS